MAFLSDTDIFLHHGAHCKLSVNFQVEEYFGFPQSDCVL